MTAPDAFPPEMRILRFPLGSDPLVLDERTADGLVSQAILPDDAPPVYRDVAAVISALTQRPTGVELDDEPRAVARIAATIASVPSPPSRRSSMPRKLPSVRRTAALVAAASLTLLGGLAAAGELPGVAEKDGIDVPGPNDASNGHTDVRGASEEDHPAGDLSEGAGSDISDTATTTDATGVDKGAEISDQASDGQSQAGEEHPGADVPPEVPVTTPSEADDGLSHRP